MPLDIDYDIYNGVSVITVLAKRDTPEIKTTNYHSCLNAYQLAQEHECFDAILVDENQVVFEGSRSNLFWIKKDSLFTKETGVLPGVTRNTIITHSPYAVKYGELNVLDFDWLSELFLTNSGSGIVPIVKVNNSIIGNGVPGPITKELMKLYDSWAFDF
jgi:Branched-chain amino acid aminotransferase/4-amino-4-deoxychorismate lyase